MLKHLNYRRFRRRELMPAERRDIKADGPLIRFMRVYERLKI